MAFTVLDTALTTLDAVKDELGIDSSDTTQDSRLSRLINAASSFIEDSVCGRVFGRAVLTERMQGSDTLIIQVARWPIRSVSNVSIDGTSLTEAQQQDPYLADGDQYVVLRTAGQIFRKAGWRWSAKAQNDLTWDPNPYAVELNVCVSYDGGYVTPQMVVSNPNGPARDLPAAIEEATIRAVIFLSTTAPGTMRELTPGNYRRDLFNDGLLHDLDMLLSRYIKYDRADALPDGA
ncbi:MAG: phage head-tail connector protein [Candidatus Xenobia bacterium]